VKLTALYLGAVLGPGALVLPALARQAAGPAALLAWVGLLALSVPVATAFARLGERFPGGHGVAGFVGQAFGPRPQAAVGWLFYLVGVPFGTLAGAFVGGSYVAHALGGGDPLLIGALILVAAYAANYAGLHVSARVQVVLVGLLAALLATAVVLQAPHVRPHDFQPFAPHGWLAVGSAAVVLFYAFSGWEAASHLSGEFPDPRKATRRTLAVVTVLYLGLAVTTTAIPGDVPLATLLENAFGPSARPVTAVAATLLTFGAVNTYLAGGAQLGVALGVKGLPVLTALSAALIAATAVWDLGLDTLMGVASTTLAAVTAAGMAAAVKLLPNRAAPAVALAFTVVVLAFSGIWLLIPLVVGLVSARVGSAVPVGRSSG
jgi:amino acid efflux transporter